MFRLPGGSWGFKARDGAGVERMQIGCGRCLLCRKSRALDLSTRMQQEAYMHAQSCVPTLTYAPEHLTALGRPQWRADVDTWLQDVRNVARRKWGQRVRYDICSEYSPDKLRPHVHAILLACGRAMRIAGSSRALVVRNFALKSWKPVGRGAIASSRFFARRRCLLRESSSVQAGRCRAAGVPRCAR